MSSVLVATGGTAAWHDGDQRMLAGAELAERAGLRFDAVRDTESLPSWDLGIAEMEAIAHVVCQAIDEGARSIVVNHGTDTLEETAWLTDLCLGPARRSQAAVMFTGSMRFADASEADGPANLRAAFELSRSSAGEGSGVQVTFAGRTHAARWARKLMIDSLDPFDSAGRPSASLNAPSSGGELDGGVVLLKVGAVSRPDLPVDATGLVVEGTGAAHAPSRYHAALRQMADGGTPVVLATRLHDRRRPPRSDGWFYGCDLTAEKAALALMVGLGAGRAGLEEWWDELMAGARFAGG